MGEALEELIIHWKHERAEQKIEKANRRANAPEYLRQAEIEFESKNGGAHLVVYGKNGVIDFWPGTERFIDRKTRKKNFGLDKLLKHALGVEDDPA